LFNSSKRFSLNKSLRIHSGPCEVCCPLNVICVFFLIVPALLLIIFTLYLLIHYAGKSGFNQFLGPLQHDIQQQPQVIIMAVTTDRDNRIEAISPLHRPNHFSNMSVKGSLIPEFSASAAENDVSPPRALVMLPSGEVLLGIKVQQKVPNILHTPPFSANNISKAILFCHAISQHSYLLLPTRKEKIRTLKLFGF